MRIVASLLLVVSPITEDIMSNVLIMEYVGIPFVKEHSTEGYIEFDKSWELLMKVVEKINCEISINFLESKLQKNGIEWCVDTENSMLLNTYEVIVNYLKWERDFHKFEKVIIKD